MIEFDIINEQGATIKALEVEVSLLRAVVAEKEQIIQRLHRNGLDCRNVIADFAGLIEYAQNLLDVDGARELLRRVRAGEVL